MIVVGGVYREECIHPKWSRIFGSGGRAASALSILSPQTVLHTYASRTWSEDVRHSMAAFGIIPYITDIDDDISFHYFHPLSDAGLEGHRGGKYDALIVSGEAVLRFGFVEGDAIVTADRVIYDPQHWEDALRFRENGSSANSLAIVLNETELSLSTGLHGEEAMRALMERSGADLVVIKRGVRGAQVYDGQSLTGIPAYKSDSIFKIGSGDIFSACFAHYWGEKRYSPSIAADLASRAAAQYVATKNVQISTDLTSEGNFTPILAGDGPVYIAAPFFNLGQRWVVEESKRALSALGVEVFSPIHDVGTGGGPEYLAQGDLEGLRQCKSVLAIVDGEDAGTLFEIGYARSINVPVVVLAESVRGESFTMLEGTGCTITDDFTTAIYHSAWASAG